ncbi:MAG: YhcH/YjgK/YiaL family protein [bacterium]
MIIDKLDNAAVYMAISPGISKALKLLQSGELDHKEIGKYELEGTEFYMIIQEYKTKSWTNGKLEVHRKYIDVQYVVSGEEKMGYAPMSSLTDFEPYNEEKDIAFHAGIGDLTTVSAGMIAIFFPHDAHAPALGISEIGGDDSRKIVLKIAI